MTDFMVDAPSNNVISSHRNIDWFQFRRRHPDLGFAKTGDDGSVEDWQALLREVGQDAMTTAVIKARTQKRDGAKIWIADVLTALDSDKMSAGGSGQSGTDPAITARNRADLLVWCICHSSRCYADALQPWKDAPGEDTVSKRTYLGPMRRIPKVDPLTPERRASVEAMADRARAELLHQTGLTDTKYNRTRLYYYVSKDKTLMSWLITQRLIPSPKPH